MKRIIVKIALFCFLYVLILNRIVLSENGKDESPSKIIIVLFDALRADHLSCYGYERKTSPTIDMLAENGVLFKNNYTQGVTTIFSLPTIFFSRYFPPMLHEPFNFIEYVKSTKEDEKSIQEILQENDFYTTMITTNIQFFRESPFAQSFCEFISLDGEPTKIKASFDDVNKEVFRWLDVNKEKKFFLFLHLMDTHFPHILSSSYQYMWLTQELLNGISEDRKIELMKGTASPPYNTLEVRFMKALYDGSILYADYQLSLMLKKLESLNILDETTIVICADHGELLGDDGCSIQHFSIPYDILMKTPLIFFGKGIPKGKKINTITENVDIVPTILDLLGIKTEVKFDGMSLVPYFKNKNIPNNQKSYTLLKYSTNQSYNYPYTLVLTDSYFKLLYNELDECYHFWTIEYETNFIKQNICKDGVKFPNADFSSQYTLEFQRMKDYLIEKIIPLYDNYKKKPPQYIFIPSRVISEHIVNQEDCVLILSEGLSEFEKFNNFIKDNKWGFDTKDPFLWAANWSEEVSPLNLSFDIDNGNYDIYIRILCTKDLKGYPATKVKCTVNDNLQTLIDSTDCEALSVKYVKIGQTNINDGKLLITLEAPPDKNSWSGIFGFKLVNININYPQNVNNEDIDVISNTEEEKGNKKEKEKILPLTDKNEQLRNLGYF